MDGPLMSISQLTYHPVVADSALLLSSTHPSQLLVVGDELPKGFEAATLTRLIGAGGVPLPSGVYSFVTEAGRAVMTVLKGTPPREPIEADWHAADDHPLVRGYGCFDAWWTDARSVPMPVFDLGATVIT